MLKAVLLKDVSVPVVLERSFLQSKRREVVEMVIPRSLLGKLPIFLSRSETVSC